MYENKTGAKTCKVRRQPVKLGGLDRSEKPGEGTLSHCLGLSGRRWPWLAQRLGREAVCQVGNAHSLYAFGKLCWVEGTTLYYDGRPVGAVTQGEKQFAVVNTKLCVFPDRKYLDLTTGEFGDLWARSEGIPGSAIFTEDSVELDEHRGALSTYRVNEDVAAQHLTFKVFREEDLVWDAQNGWGEMPFETVGGAQAITLEPGVCFMLPASAVRGNRFPDCAVRDDVRNHGFAQEYDRWGDYVCLREPITFDDRWPYRYSEYRMSLERRSMAAHTPKFLDRGFKAGDTVKLSGCVTFPENNREVRIAAIDGTRVTFDAQDFTPGAEEGTVVLERWVPQMDFVCESGNRLFGASSAANTVYASALGDPTNFRTAGDSFAQAVGSDGDFTGCAAFSGSVLFFKEDCLHRLMGARPASYGVYTDQVAGLQKGCAGSLAVVNEVLYYKGREGVYAYSGSTPKLISAPLGPVSGLRAVGIGDGARYRLGLEKPGGAGWELLCYDPAHGLWWKEDDLETRGFARLEGKVYLLSGGTVWALDQGEEDGEGPVSWEATFAPFTADTFQGKYPSRLLLELELGEGAWVEAQLARDGGLFQALWTGKGALTPTVAIPIRPGRCHSAQLRLLGQGRCAVKAVAREFSLGGVG